MQKIELKNPSYIETEDIKNAIIGKTITAIRFNEDALVLEFGDEYLGLGVEGDCCSSSYFYDFYGVKKILGHKVVDFTDIALDPTDLKAHDDEGECIQVYGYKIICEPNDDEYQTSNTAVFSFRNSSNGYYGGSLNGYPPNINSVPIIEDDKVLS